MKAAKASTLQAMIALIIMLSNFGIRTEAKFLAMRPLTARQVYRLLHESERTDAIPQGRVITQGLAAMTGFALGLTKGLGGALLFDIITANVTAGDLEAAVNGNGNGSGGTTLTTQEVCFNSRNARTLEEAEAVVEAYSRASDRKQEKRKVRRSEVERRFTRKRRDKRRKKSKKRPGRLVLEKQFEVMAMDGGEDNVNNADNDDATAAATGDVIATAAESPTVSSAGSGTNEDNGEGTGTTVEITTETDNDRAINCVVIQKPAVG